MISSISDDFSSRWSTVLKDAKIKHLRLVLKTRMSFPTMKIENLTKELNLYTHIILVEKRKDVIGKFSGKT